MKPRLRSLGYTSIVIFSIVSIGILSLQGITNAQTTESTQTIEVPVYVQGSDITKQDCADFGGTFTINYEAGAYECILR